MMKYKIAYSVFTLRLLQIITFCFLPCCLYAQQETDNNLTFLLYFRINSFEIDPSYLSNAATLEAIGEAMHSADAAVNVNIEVFSSPDGRESFNKQLSENRAKAVENYFSQKFSHLTERYTMEAVGLGENWSGLLNEALSDSLLPGREQLIHILKDSSLSRQIQKEKIKQLAGGKTYTYLIRNDLPKLRLALIAIKKVPVTPSVALPPVEEVATVPQQVNEVSDDTLVVMITETPTVPRPRLAVKTNLAAYVFGVANLGVEVILGKRFSLDLPLYYSPYTLSSSYRFRILASQPELRYWFSSALKGHFIGLYATGGWYNVSFNKHTRYQDRDGDTPAWGGGLSYGFALAINRRWGMEFTAGAGYLRLEYDTFYNLPNGAKFGTQSKSYYGLTKLGVTLTYQILK